VMAEIAALRNRVAALEARVSDLQKQLSPTTPD
jgi:tetrahydromethanopterin S-methyltransferase subunit B